MLGIMNDELYLRWCQYGVFSPINRLHSSNFLLQGKEPWKRSETVRRITGDYLRLRHAMLPYLYTAMQRTAKDNEPICKPLYYEYPEEEGAYFNKNQYFFGSEMLVCPITSPVSKYSRKASVDVWLPKGRFTDFFTGHVYEGGKYLTLCRDVEFYPVLMKEGAILVTSEESGNSTENPTKIKIYAYRGNNEYTLYEDDGVTTAYKDGKYVITKMIAEETGDTFRFSVKPSEGDVSLIPETRDVTLVFGDIVGGEVEVNGQSVPWNAEIRFTLDVQKGAEVVVKARIAKDNGDIFEKVNDAFSRSNGGNLIQTFKYFKIAKAKNKEELIEAIKKSRFHKSVKKAALEELS